MGSYPKISTGHAGIDSVVDALRLGDNVVWQVDDIETYASIVDPFVVAAKAEGRRVVCIRFDSDTALVEGIEQYTIDPDAGFEAVAAQVHTVLTAEGLGVFYVFDPLTILLDRWGSDLMVMNFFKVTCPYLFELDTVAYFCLQRTRHSFETIAGIRETTQLLLDLHRIGGVTYVHPHKVWNRYSPTMFFPHRVDSSSAVPVTSSSESAELFGKISHQEPRRDAWRSLLDEATAAQSGGDAAEEQNFANQLLGLLIGRDGRMVELASKHLSLADLLQIAHRRIGSGRIGGKATGLVVAGAIASKNAELAPHLEMPDSFYLGSDLFFTYLIECGWWKEWMAQKTASQYYEAGARLHHNLGTGQFPPVIRERFTRLLEYFGQSPIIVRSSSLLEDNFGNAFSGKYQSVFCANQGDPEQRLRAFEDAIRIVYASAMGPDALAYREDRGLSSDDEQMAVLVQRVCGDHHGQFFFPDAAGVGNSHNLYVFDRDVDPAAGALRLVLGLGTRAVDRLGDDYARMVALDHPLRVATATEDRARYSQKKADVLDLAANSLAEVPIRELEGLPEHWSLMLSPDREMIARLRERGRPANQVPPICDFDGLLRTDFVPFMRELLGTLERAYDYPVDIEFAITVGPDSFRVCLLQCRPLQTRGVGSAVKIPEIDPALQLISTKGEFMGGNLDQDVDVVLYVKPEQYLLLGEQQRHQVAREVGIINKACGDKKIMAIGPGRWGTSTASLGVPVHFSEISKVAILVETTDPELGFNVDLSFGSHFFQDLVETGIFFVALDLMRDVATFSPSMITDCPNLLADYCPGSSLEEVIHVAHVPALHAFADVVNQDFVAGVV